MADFVDSLCPYCGVVCQVRYHLRDGCIGWAEALNGPSNRGRLCVKGRFGWDYAQHPDRLTRPLVRREGAPKVSNPADPFLQFREASWDEALERTTRGFVDIKNQYGGAYLGAFGTAKGSNEEGYLLQKLVRTGFGTHSVDHCARLCHSSSVVALFEQLGSGAVTAPFTECERADVILVVGVNPCESFPVAAAFMKRAVQRGTKLILVDVRRTALASFAHLFLALRPASDISLFNAMAQVIIAEKLYDSDFVEKRVTGFEALARSVGSCTPEAVSTECGIAPDLIREAARLLGNAHAAMIFWGVGITQHVHGVRNARTLVNLGLITGNVGRPGTGLHPLRGQNNVQGVSDMGVLPNFLPGYAKADDREERGRFEAAWGMALPTARGLTIVEMVNAAATGEIKGLYFMGENPAMSDPDASHVREALTRLDHLVVQDIFLTETAVLADVVLPGASMFEKWGTFTNTNRQIQFSQPVIACPGEARQDWWIVQEIARRMGLAWRYAHPREIWEEIRSLWPAVGGITWKLLTRDGWAQYPCREAGDVGNALLFKERFGTALGRAKLVAVERARPAETTDATYPNVLITGRTLETWHTGVLSRHSSVLDQLEPKPFVCLSGDDLTTLGASVGDTIRVSSRRGAIKVQARLGMGLPRGTLFMPFCFAEAAANLLTHAALDPESMIPEYKFCAVRVDNVNAVTANTP